MTAGEDLMRGQLIFTCPQCGQIRAAVSPVNVGDVIRCQGCNAEWVREPDGSVIVRTPAVETEISKSEFATMALRIVAKLSAAAANERKDVFILTLASFAATCCQRWGVPYAEFYRIMSGAPTMPVGEVPKQ